MTKQIRVFDPALCCSTGVCGPDVDPALTKMAKLHLDVQKAGFDMERYNLAQEPQPFVENSAVKQLLDTEGADALPAITVDGELVMNGRYPDRSELAAFLDVEEKELQSKAPSTKVDLL
ncbi:arsenite efflux transporter metallochaperone ArsD [Bacillus daqingensis]|uniref:Arsenite efflux transporter metallochaperone ArsD n=1 Tax=Bacillus daqingensis TaxID=872396 RepID=A0ABV9NVQ7_9BACI